jgi:hypothetical protein
MLLLLSITQTLSLLLGSWLALFIGLLLEASEAFLIKFEKQELRLSCLYCGIY